MHVVFVNFGYPAAVTDPEELLARFEGLEGWANGIVEAGGQATVLQRFSRNAVVHRNNVAYHLVADGGGPNLRSWKPSRPVQGAAVELCRASVERGQQTALHLNGLMYGVQAWQMRRQLPPLVPIVAQHHAERPPSGLRLLYSRRSLRAVTGFFFTARAQADSWLASGLILPTQPIFEVMEGSTAYGRQERTAARTLTGLTGDPVFLWVGRLIDLKDPLVVLRGFEEVLRTFPVARLFLAYGSDDLLPAVKHQISSSTALSRAVTLLGCVPHGDMEAIYNSADFFVLGSHSEGSGYALVEALACGVVPVVTDIPSFRRMTDGGKIGALWPPGDAAGFAAAVRQVLARSWEDQSAAARRQFEQQLSFSVIGQQALAAYRWLARSGDQ